MFKNVTFLVTTYRKYQNHKREGKTKGLSLKEIKNMEKEMATHSSVLARRIPGTGEPGGLPSVGSHRVGHD